MEKYLMLDTETANTIDDPFYYDLGYAVIDENGTIYETASFVNADIFLDPSMMENAYFKEKIPQYWREIKNGSRILKRHTSIKRIVREVMQKYNITYVVAHNAAFDWRSTAYTQRLLTSSKYRFFFRYGTKILDTLKMAREVLSDDTDYINFCTSNNYLTSNGNLRFTAEILYRYLTKNPDFVESHTGLEDVLIEKEIFTFCKKRNPKVNGLLW